MRLGTRKFFPLEQAGDRLSVAGYSRGSRDVHDFRLELRGRGVVTLESLPIVNVGGMNYNRWVFLVELAAPIALPSPRVASSPTPAPGTGVYTESPGVAPPPHPLSLAPMLPAETL